MTAFSTSNVPASVTTVEELFVWCASALAEINSDDLIQTLPGQSEPVVTAQTFSFQSETNSPERFVVVGYIPLAAGWRSAGKIFGEGISEISVAPLPANYTS